VQQVTRIAQALLAHRGEASVAVSLDTGLLPALGQRREPKR
jgi:hypothetical protein